jgi:2-keto-3-deoxy-L-rhamnonate aldolase RhmA
VRTNIVRQKIRGGEPTIGCFMGLGSPTVAELLAHAGFDWLVIETEHSAVDIAEVQHMLMAMSGTNVVPLVRVQSSNPVFIQRALDIGAMGIVVPLVNSAAEAQQVVAATRFPPQGTRSFGPLRAGHFTFDSQDYFERADDNILTILILETKGAVDSLEEISALPGIDGLYVGEYDLSLSLGLNPMSLPLPEIDAVIERLLAVAGRTGIAAGIGASTPDQLLRRRDQGFTLLGYGPEYVMLSAAAREGVASFRGDTAQKGGQ